MSITSAFGLTGAILLFVSLVFGLLVYIEETGPDFLRKYVAPAIFVATFVCFMLAIWLGVRV